MCFLHIIKVIKAVFFTKIHEILNFGALVKCCKNFKKTLKTPIGKSQI
ncbi:Putative hypothetical proteins [Helicobacter mustelae 12198]|uniref:Uncharacterized protein n=1 Tax=Helicobacter mustelae (strain ATCC 43772 / CCUG 25715 / CIP 103759 / LMG 18044 / NCTC 12198 / R85-136P) TaxID=679897 RepID=D3UHF3_HELM1|nr:Putative hypothetical proteins [Helicobacter mustelae 12198]